MVVLFYTKLINNLLFLEKKRDKKDLVRVYSPSRVKVVFTLLAKIIILYMKITQINFGKPSLKWLFLRIGIL